VPNKSRLEGSVFSYFPVSAGAQAVKREFGLLIGTGVNFGDTVKKDLIIGFGKAGEHNSSLFLFF